VGGAFRANNQVSIGEPIYTYTDEIDNDGQSTIAKGQAALAKVNPYSIIYIQNNRPYAERLEYGDHSKQAPEGIYAVSFHGVSQAYK
ncbi:HK97 gp10 family phage protein, partial [Rosenbergiella australiborealis]|uniref:HK97 gp10 family phage protein n=1 Tax=Rosenbergiella australiborealis TaxID=1544696 RepID=UPI001F4DE54F